MKFPVVFACYVTKHFLINLVVIALILTGFIMLFDLLEMVRQTHGKDIPFSIVLEMMLLRLPSLIEDMIPYAVLLGGIVTFARLSRTSEMTVARSSGVSAAQFLSFPLIVSFVLGIITIIAFNPLSAVMLSRFEKVEAKHVLNTPSMLSVSSKGLWLRQRNDFDQEKTIIHALRVSHENITLFDVSIFMFDHQDRFKQRVDAPEARLGDGYWFVADAILTQAGEPPTFKKEYRIKTSMSEQQIQESFSTPDTVSFWELPGFIANLQKAGFSALRHSLHFHQILVQPFLFCAMLLFAAAFSLRLPRQGKTGLLLATGVFFGVIIRFIGDVVGAFGLSGSIPVVLAAWGPTLVWLFFGVALVLHTEES